MDARERSTATIRSEHNSMLTVLMVLQHVIEDVVRRGREPDFELLSAALYYFDDFPERCHHPKEDEYFFAALRRRTTALNAELDELQAEHIRSDQMVTHLQCALVRYQGGAPDGLAQFRAEAAAYAAMLESHMKKEEALLAASAGYLLEDDWTAMAAAFATNVDPLTEIEGSADYTRLFSRIVMRLPEKLRRRIRRDAQPAGE